MSGLIFQESLGALQSVFVFVPETGGSSGAEGAAAPSTASSCSAGAIAASTEIVPELGGSSGAQGAAALGGSGAEGAAAPTKPPAPAGPDTA